MARRCKMQTYDVEKTFGTLESTLSLEAGL